jgi:hypothetical protein
MFCPFRILNDPPITCKHYSSPHSCYLPCQSHRHDFSILIILGEQYKLRNTLLCSFLRIPVTCVLGRNNILSTYNIYVDSSYRRQLQDLLNTAMNF